MKVFVLLVVIAVAYAKPQTLLYTSQYSSVSQQPVQAPYPAVRFNQFGARQQQVPQTFYGPPAAATTESEATTTELAETTTEPASESIDQADQNQSQAKNAKLIEGAEVTDFDQGTYYVYHPHGVLQRVVYSGGNDAQNMAYVAQLRYQNVEPIREPIYTYDPDTFVLQRVQL